MPWQSCAHLRGCPFSRPSSQISPSSSSPLPHVSIQSLSVLGSAPRGQQPSSSIGSVIDVSNPHSASHVSPNSFPGVQAFRGGHSVGHAPGSPAGMPVSQASSSSSVPYPQKRSPPVSVSGMHWLSEQMRSPRQSTLVSQLSFGASATSLSQPASARRLLVLAATSSNRMDLDVNPFP